MVQESVEALLVRKAEEIGRVLTSREEEYLRLQVERNELVLQFPHAESRGEEVLQTLQKMKNRLKKLAKGRPVDDVLKLPLKSEPPKSAAERKSDQRGKMSLQARDKEREENRKRKASLVELERGRKRKKSPEELEKAKVRMKTPEQLERGRERKKTPEELEKAKERMKTPEQLERGRERKKTPEELEKAKVRMQAPEQVEKAKERMSLPLNREKDAARKKEKRRLRREEKEKREEWPKAPACSPLVVVFPTDDMWYKIHYGPGTDDEFDEDMFDRDPTVEGPTYSPDQPLRIRVRFTCYPPPTIVWLKNGKVLARDAIKYALKEGVNDITDCKKERIAPESKLRFRVESYYRFQLPGCVVPVKFWQEVIEDWRFKSGWKSRKLMQEGWSDFIIEEPTLIDEGVYEVRIFNSYGVVSDFIEVSTRIAIFIFKLAHSKHLIFVVSQITFKPVILEDISLRAESHYFDDLERCVLRKGDSFQLQVDVSGGRVEWFKDGVLVPKASLAVKQSRCAGGKQPSQAVDHPCERLLERDKWKRNYRAVGCGKVNGKQAEPVEMFPPNMNESYLANGGMFCDLSDAGVYQAKVVSSVGERYSSAMRVEVEPEYEEWEDAKQHCIRRVEQRCSHRNAKPHDVQVKYPVGCWVKKLPYEGMSREVEAEGFDARDAHLANWMYKHNAWKYPDIIEGKELKGVSENVRQAISRIMKEKDMDLGEKLDANLDSVLQHLDEEDDWPYRGNLVKSKENLLVDSSLNHTWQSHLQWERGQADEWRKNFDEVPAEMLRWTGFRSKKVQSGRKLRLDTSDSSSSDSMSSSDSEDERSDSGAAPPAPMSVRFDEEEEILSGLDMLQLSHDEEDQVPK